MNQRTPINLTEDQSELSFNNRKFLAQRGIDYGLLSVTQTGLDKSIMDAVGSLRSYFKDNQYHNYDEQLQGTTFKVINPCILVHSDNDAQNQRVSLYRPESKTGDPRIWIYGLKRFADAGDDIALILDRNLLYVFNISKLDLSHNQLLNQIINDYEAVAQELLEKLRILSRKGTLKAIMKGDTSIGMTIEKALGIPPNSSPYPDYKGIELKSSRLNKSSNRSNLFAQVADWSISTFKSSKEIIDQYGYPCDDGDRRLYCTVTANRYNPQGLGFNVDFNNDILNEVHEQDGNVASWLGQKLRNKLLEKHRETFWIKADTRKISEDEYFSLKSVTHTKNPLASQFLLLIEQRIITMDHAIKHSSINGKITEKGPLFKIKPQHLGLLFPEPQEYIL